MPTSESSWFHKIWPRLVVASGVGYLAMAYVVSRWLTRPAPAVVGTASIPGCSTETLTCLTSDGIMLKGWIIEPAQPKGIVVVFHGMRCNRNDVLGHIKFLTEAGYRCVAFDLRAHGESGGKQISFGFYERRDVEAVAALVRARWPSERCAALGISMGGAAICFAGAAARAFDAIILESVYHDLMRAFSHRIGNAYPAWFQYFRPAVIWLTERRLGTRIQDVAPIDHVAKLAPRPVLLLTGSADPLAPPDDVQSFLAQLPGIGQFHCFPGPGHGEVYEIAGAAYRDLVLGFLEQHLFHKDLTAVA